MHVLHACVASAIGVLVGQPPVPEAPAPAAAAQPAMPAAAPKTSPFDQIYIADDGTITATIGAVTGRLASVGGVKASRVVLVAQVGFGGDWKKRIAEDLPDVLAAATGEGPRQFVEIVIVDEAGVRRTLTSRFTHDRRQHIWHSDYGCGPRDDPARPIHPAAAQGAMHFLAGLMDARWSYMHAWPTIDVEKELLMTLPSEAVTLSDMVQGVMFPHPRAAADPSRTQSGLTTSTWKSA